MGGRSRGARAERRARGMGARPLGVATHAGGRRLHAAARSGFRLAAHAVAARARDVARLQSGVRRRQPGIRRALRARTAATRRRGAVSSVRPLDSRVVDEARTRIRRGYAVAALRRGAARRFGAAVRAARARRVRHGRPAFPARGAARRAPRWQGGRGVGAITARRGARADREGGRHARRVARRAGGAARARARSRRAAGVERARALADGRPVGRAARARVHRGLPAPAECRCRALVCTGGAADRAPAAAGREDVRDRQPGAGGDQGDRR